MLINRVYHSAQGHERLRSHFQIIGFGIIIGQRNLIQTVLMAVRNLSFLEHLLHLPASVARNGNRVSVLGKADAMMSLSAGLHVEE